MPRELGISRLGAQGDGIAETPGGQVYIPFTLPGERVLAEVADTRGRLLQVLEASPERRAPICRHFGACGGCALQHFEQDACRDWKQQKVTEALTAERIDVDVEPVHAVPLQTRRRAALSAVKTGGKVTLGFRRAGSHDIVDVEECPVLLPRLTGALPGLRELLGGLLPGGEARLLLTAADNGLDVAIEPDQTKLMPFTAAHGRLAEQLGIVRLAAGRELLMSLSAPQVTFSGVAVDLPPGAFLQAAAEAESIMASLTTKAVGKAKRVADLFCGLGTFTFTLARKAAVTAVEQDRTLLAALEAAERRARGIKPVKTLARDLMREPLSFMELKAFDAAIFDPPRAGALAQAQALARSAVPLVVAVSCNPATFARDARALIDGGYRLKRVAPVDQFLFSPHVELVAVFARD